MELYQKARIAEKSEIKDIAYKVNIFDEEYKAGGPPLLFEKQNMYLDTSDSHVMFVGTSGSGKTNFLKYVIVTSIRAGENLVVLDLKQELYNQFHEELKNKGYKVVVMNFRDILRSVRWNKLRRIYKLYKSKKPSDNKKAMEELDSIATEIVRDDGAREKYWQDAAKFTFIGLVEALFIVGRPEQINLASVNYMLTRGSERFAASTYLKTLYEIIGESSTACVNIGVYLNNATETRNAVESVLRRGLSKLIASEALNDTFSNDGFDISSIDNEKTAIFIVTPDETTKYKKHSEIFINQIYQQYLSLAHEKYNGRLPIRTNFILEEFGNMRIEDAPTMFSAVRSRNIRMYCVLQSFAQLEQYGPEAKVIKDNCGLFFFFHTPDIETLEEFSRLSGERRVDINGQPSIKPILSATDLLSLKIDEVYFRMKDGVQHVTKIPHFSKAGIKEPKQVEVEEREFKEISLFDIQEFVKSKKREKFSKMTADLSNVPF